MTKTARKLMSEFKTALEKLPEAEQEERVASYLEDLHRRMKAKKSPQSAEGEDALYEPFQVMLDANLDLPSDYSETYEEHLYAS